MSADHPENRPEGSKPPEGPFTQQVQHQNIGARVPEKV